MWSSLCDAKLLYSNNVVTHFICQNTHSSIIQPLPAIYTEIPSKYATYAEPPPTLCKGVLWPEMAILDTHIPDPGQDPVSDTQYKVFYLTVTLPNIYLE